MVHKCAYPEFHFPMHENARFHGWERKNEPAVHEKDCFRGRDSGYLLYLHDVLRFLKMTMKI